MTQYSTQHASEIQDGPTYKVHANHLIDNFNALSSDINDRLSMIAVSAQSVGSAVTWGGIQTFSASPVFSTSISFTHNNTHTGRENFAQTDTTNLTTNGDILYDTSTNLFKGYINGAIQQFVTLNSSLPSRYRESALPVWATNTTITMAYITSRDSTDVIDIKKTSSSTLDFSGNGAVNRLDTGTIANNTNYFIYEICKADGSLPGLLASTVNEAVTGSITLPTNYVYKRQTVWVVRTDGSAHIVPFKAIWQNQSRGKMAYNVAMSQQDTGSAALTVTGQTNILSVGVQSSNTSITATASWALPNSKFVDLHYSCYETQARIYEDGTTNYIWITGTGSSGFVSTEGFIADVPLSSAYKIGYAVPGGQYGLSLDVRAFTTEVS